MTRQRDLLVAEVFGPTVQGEGPSAGRNAVFARVSGCNLSCSWCDTPYTWDTARFDLRTHRERVSTEELTARVLALPAPLVVVTGGEPLLQAGALVPAVEAWREAGRSVEMETNGTLPPPAELTELGVRWNVSPKLSNSDLPEARRIRPDALRAFLATGLAVFKFVVTEPSNLDEVAALERDLGLAPIWVMPEGQRTERVIEVLRRIADQVIGRGWNLTTRLQVLVWEAERGR